MSITYWFKPYQTAITEVTYLVTTTKKFRTKKEYKKQANNNKIGVEYSMYTVNPHA
jgi:hypothetical protein